jgi:thiol-disulfide isomerase/thioredoxin
MKVIKITALWCSGCLIMNKVWNKVLETKDIETISLDYDMDEEEVSKYNPGNVLPVFIFMKDDKEVKRITGEKTYEEMISIINEVGE